MEVILLVSNFICISLWKYLISPAYAGVGEGHTHGPNNGSTSDLKLLLVGFVIFFVFLLLKTTLVV